MKVRVESTELPEVLLVRPEVFRDHRGEFREVFRSDVFAEAGLPTRFPQVNQSTSEEGVVRGLHFQWDPPMGKLMRVVRGRAFVVAVDIRHGSPRVGRWVGAELSEGDGTSMWAPAGFARGFCALDGPTDVEYLCTATYRGEGESGILWNDPDVGVAWPRSDPVLSDRDRNAPTLSAWLASPEARSLRYAG